MSCNLMVNYWYCYFPKWYAYFLVFKRQNTIESSTFGSEFVAIKIAMEMNEALHYKLKMMDIPISGESNCFNYSSINIAKET
jgi:hypothetical protein